MSDIVAIVGRPNVGKSTLFNRLTGRRTAIVDDMSGVSRDRQYGTSEWNGKTFTVVDTGGYVANSKDIFDKAIRKQVELALDECAVVLFMVDVKTDVTDLDIQFASILRRIKKPILVVVNKLDDHKDMAASAVFWSLGFKELFPLSSMTGSGSGELLDKLVEYLPDNEEKIEEDVCKVAVIGRPNVGKSSFINTILGVDRNIVTDIAGTTRDSIHSHYNFFGHDMVFIDTAGIRKKSKVTDDVEFYSVVRALNALEECSVCVLVVDATRGLESQDMTLFSQAVKLGKGVVVLVNKWDLIEKETNTAKEFEEKIKQRMAPFVDLPIVFISATNKQRVFKAVETISEVYKRLDNKIKTSALNDFLLPLMERTPPPMLKGKVVKIKYVTQLKTRRKSFILFCNLPQYVADSYKRFIENRLREEFDLHGVPLDLFFRKK